MNHSPFTSNKPYLFNAIYQWIIDNNATPYILVDVNKPMVEVPGEHVKDQQIVLNINPGAVKSWHVDQQGISFSARFSGSPRQIYVPMNALMAIYAQENGQGMAFPAEEPEVDSNINDTAESKEKVTAQSKADINESLKANADKKSGRGSHLKVIK